MTPSLGVELANQKQALERTKSNCGQQSMLAKQEASFLKDIENVIRACSGAVMTRHPTGVTVSASGPEGFSMSLMVESGRYAVYFDNWFEELYSADAAREVFEAALKGQARLKVDVLSGRRWRWTLERQDADGLWRTESATGHVIWRFWGRASQIYLCNTFLPVILPDANDRRRAN